MLTLKTPKTKTIVTRSWQEQLSCGKGNQLHNCYRKLNDKKKKVQISLLLNLKSGKLGETKNYPVLTKTEGGR